MYKILIVEDDNTIAERLASHLKKWNYKTVCVRDFKNVMEEFKKTDPQLCNPGYRASVLQWILLVPGDPETVQCADHLSVIDE